MDDIAASLPSMPDLPSPENPPAELAKSGMFGMILRLMAMALIIGSLFYSLQGLYVVILLFIIVVPFEKLFPRHKGQRVRRPHLGTDVGYAMASPILGIVTLVVSVIIAIVSLAWIPGLLLKPYVAKIPENWLPVVGFLLFDFLVFTFL